MPVSTNASRGPSIDNDANDDDDVRGNDAVIGIDGDVEGGDVGIGGGAGNGTEVM